MFLKGFCKDKEVCTGLLDSKFQFNIGKMLYFKATFHFSLQKFVRLFYTALFSVHEPSEYIRVVRF